MSRALHEWIATHDDAQIPPRVRLRVFENAKGICHLTKRKITAGEAWDCDHVVALINGGEHRESNLAPALRSAHRVKTADDVRQKAKSARIRARHAGIKKRSTFACSRDSRFRKKINGKVELR